MARVRWRKGCSALTLAVALAAAPRFVLATDLYTGPDKGLWTVPGNWSGGVVPNSSAHDVEIAGAVQVLMNATETIGNLSLATPATLSILSASLILAGTSFSNTGVVLLNATSSTPTLSFFNGGVLSGGGTVRMAAATSTLTGGDRLTTDNLITGQGTVKFLKITNSGTITGGAGGVLTMMPVVALDGFINTGLLSADGGTLALQAGIYNNTGGVIEASPQSLVTLNGGTITGGTLGSTGTGIAAFLGGTTALANVTLTGTVNATRNNTTLLLTGTTRNDGTFTFKSSGAVAHFSGVLQQTGMFVLGGDLQLDGDSSFTGGGTVVLTSGGRILGPPPLSNLSTIAGGGSIMATLLNSGTISATSGTLSVGGGTNTGYMSAAGGMLLFSGSMNNAGGVIESVVGSPLSILGVVDGGVVKVSSTPIALTGTLSNATISGDASISGNQARIAGTLSIDGKVALLSNLVASPVTALTGAGSMTLAGSNLTVQGSFTNSAWIGGKGSLTLTSSSPFVNNGTISASGGTLTVGDLGHPITNSGTLLADVGSMLSVRNASNTGAGQIVLLANSTYSGGISGGSINAADSSAMLVDSSLTNVTIVGNPTVVAKFASPQLGGTVSFAGDLTVIGGLGGTATLTGGGRMLLNATSAIPGFNAVLTNGSANTIIGEGSISPLQLYNAGTITTAGGTLVIKPLGSPAFIENTGLLRADGGTLSLSAIVNTGGTIEALPNSMLMVSGSFPIPGIGGGVVNIAAGGAFSASALTMASVIFNNSGNATLATTTLNGTLTNTGLVTYIKSQLSISGLAGTFDNRAQVQLNGITLTLSADSSFTGGGTVTMASAVINGNFQLTSNNLITGTGAIGQTGASFSLSNSGTITATGGTLMLQFPNTSPAWINSGVLRAEAGAMTFSLTNMGTLTNAGGLIEAASGSRMTISQQRLLISGGSVTAHDGGLLAFSDTLNSNSILSTIANATISASNGGVMLLANVTNSTIISDASSTITITKGTITDVAFFGPVRIQPRPQVPGIGMAGTLLNHGVLIIGDGSSFGMTASANTTLSGMGTVTLISGGIGGSGANVFTSDNLITGQGVIGGPFINNGTVMAMGSSIGLSTGAHTNRGVMIANGTLSLGLFPGSSNITLDNTGGIIQVASNSTFFLYAGLSGGRILLSNAASSIINFNGGTLTNVAFEGDGIITGGPQLFLNASHSFTGHVQLLPTAGNVLLLSANTWSGSGTLTLGEKAVVRAFSTVMPLTIAMRVDGGGNLGGGFLSITNIGAIIANATTGMTIAPSGFTSTGVLRADGAAMTFLNSSYTISGTLETKNNGTLNFNAGTYQINSPITLDGGAVNFNATSSGGARTTLITGTGAVAVGQGTTLLSDGVRTAGLTLSGKHAIRAGSGDAGTSLLQAITLPTAQNGDFLGTLDLNDNRFILQTLPGDKNIQAALLQAAMLSGFHGGDYRGTGISSSTLIADHSATGSHLLTLSLFDNAEVGLATFGGQGVDSNSLLITTALLADTNLDGAADATDFDNWHSHAATFSPFAGQGDFNHDGMVDGRDFDLWYTAAGPLAQPTLDARGLNRDALSAITVPEPGTLGTLAIAAIWLVKSRRVARRRLEVLRNI